MLEVVGQDIISGNMGFIGTDPDRLYRMGAAEKTEDITVTGNPAVLDNATGKPFKELHIYGRSEQMTTTGAQLLDLDALELRQDAGATIKRLDDGGFLINGTPKAAYEQYIRGFQLDIAPGTYFVSGGRNADGCVVAQVNILNADGTRTYRKNASFNVLGTEQEITLVIQSVSEAPINNYKIYPMINSGSVAVPFEPYTGGKPSPSPDYPQEIQSAGDDGNLSVIVKNPDNEQMQSVSFSTPNGLPGIPVTSGGNYTDENGQQWVCDEVDLGRGVYVQRIASFVINAKNANDISVTNLYTHVTVAVNARISTPEKTIASSATVSTRNLFCEALPWIADAWARTVNSMGFVENSMVDFTVENSYLGLSEASTNDERKAALVKYFTDKPCQIVYRIATPIETPLTASEIAAYKSLRTYRGTTIVEAEDKAGISVTFKRNAKTDNVSAEKKIEGSKKKEYDES